ncbi:MAG: hypothetical protein AUK47_24560 [Deltaproteobacteria bacterium CG2_30_63_29]|nr:MAG: hypothetical protein AUK47_24560 [Deltaproteobacteria bacterium CG2_30_63_29]PJB42425.1 MAG: hypothetical protein CO108_11620 [Deltaproteobacteria bacterium CG_4_9_14_3_um_filter_63_12]
MNENDFSVFETSRIPTPPRKPSARARELIFRYQGKQKITLIIGVAFFGMGLLFSFIFLWELPVDIVLDLGIGTTDARGRVVSNQVRENIEINGQNPYEIACEYQFAGKTFHVSSYVMDPVRAQALQTDTEVELEVVASHPAWARISGTQRSAFGYWVAVFLLFPVAGVVCLFLSIRSNRREIRAYREGQPIMARVTFRGEDLTASSNGRHPFLVKWTFTVSQQRYEGSLSHMDRAMLGELLDANQVPVLYLPENPLVNTVYVP